MKLHKILMQKSDRKCLFEAFLDIAYVNFVNKPALSHGESNLFNFYKSYNE